jgi:hypothetical protein
MYKKALCTERLIFLLCVYARAHTCVHHIKDDNDINTTHTNKQLVKTSQGNWDKSHFPLRFPPIILPFIHSYTLYLLKNAMKSGALYTHTVNLNRKWCYYL